MPPRHGAAALGAAALGVSLLGHAWAAPFTKVEESFTLQAVHDLLTYGVWHIEPYDHVAFPGAVPRSFVGPLLLAALSAPILSMLRAIVALHAAHVQLLVRFVLGAATWGALVHFAQQVLRARTAQTYFFWICATQFHLVFWATRTTPNSVAFPLVVAALGSVLGPSPRGRVAGLALLAAVACTLRLEVVGLAAPAYLWAWLRGHLTFPRAMALGLASCAAGALLSLSVDCWFWHPVPRDRLPGLGRIVWPEVGALLFNVVEGHSAAWGIAPWHAYWTKELPKLLAATLPLVAVGLLAPTRGSSARTPLALFAVFHTCLLSALAHKEWRFLQYTLPLWNALSALGAAYLVQRPGTWAMRSITQGLPTALIGFALLLSVLYNYVSQHNYPGGVGLQAAHARLAGQRVHLHMDTHATMTGVSRFQSTHFARPAGALVPSAPPTWVYDKTENRPPSSFWCTVTHLLTETPCEAPRGTARFAAIHAPIFGLAGVRRKAFGAYVREVLQAPWQPTRAAAWAALMPVVLHLEPQLYLCQREAC